MALRSLVKCFSFTNRDRASLTFSDPTLINIVNNRLELKRSGTQRATGAPLYPTATDISATTALTNPQKLRQWVSFGMLPTTAKQPAGTTVQFKINDGTDDLYWDGGAWAVAGASDWNTEVEIATNIGTFPVTSKQLALVINLVASSDGLSTPSVQFVDLWMSCDFDYLKSIIVGALIPSLKANVRPTLDFCLRHTGGTQFNLRDFETEFQIVSVVAVYNEDTDPDHTTDLFSTFDSSSEVVTLTGSVERGTVLCMQFEFEPEVYLNWSSQDFVEVEKIPAIVVDNISLIGNEVFAQMSVQNPATNMAHVRRFPFRLRFEIDVRLLAEKNDTLLSMMDKALEHLASTPLLPWPAIDESISMVSDAEGLFQPRPNLSDKHEMSYSLTLLDVHLWLQPEQVLPLVQQFNLTLNSTLRGGPRWTGTKTGRPC